MKVRKKAVVVDAVRVRDIPEESARVPGWLMVAAAAGTLRWSSADRVWEIVTLEGVMRAEDDDWIIRGVKGEIYPCKPDVFEATYDYPV